MTAIGTVFSERTVGVAWLNKQAEGGVHLEIDGRAGSIVMTQAHMLRHNDEEVPKRLLAELSTAAGKLICEHVSHMVSVPGPERVVKTSEPQFCDWLGQTVSSVDQLLVDTASAAADNGKSAVSYRMGGGMVKKESYSPVDQSRKSPLSRIINNVETIVYYRGGLHVVHRGCSQQYLVSHQVKKLTQDHVVGGLFSTLGDLGDFIPRIHRKTVVMNPADRLVMISSEAVVPGFPARKLKELIHYGSPDQQAAVVAKELRRMGRNKGCVVIFCPAYTGEVTDDIATEGVFSLKNLSNLHRSKKKKRFTGTELKRKSSAPRTSNAVADSSGAAGMVQTVSSEEPPPALALTDLVVEQMVQKVVPVITQQVVSRLEIEVGKAADRLINRIAKAVEGTVAKQLRLKAQAPLESVDEALRHLDEEMGRLVDARQEAVPAVTKTPDESVVLSEADIVDEASMPPTPSTPLYWKPVVEVTSPRVVPDVTPTAKVPMPSVENDDGTMATVGVDDEDDDSLAGEYGSVRKKGRLFLLAFGLLALVTGGIVWSGGEGEAGSPQKAVGGNDSVWQNKQCPVEKPAPVELVADSPTENEGSALEVTKAEESVSPDDKGSVGGMSPKEQYNKGKALYEAGELGKSALGKKLGKNGRLESFRLALPYFEELLKQDPEANPDVWFLKGRTEYKLARLTNDKDQAVTFAKAALASYEQYLSLEPKMRKAKAHTLKRNRKRLWRIIK